MKMNIKKGSNIKKMLFVFDKTSMEEFYIPTASRRTHVSEKSYCRRRHLRQKAARQSNIKNESF